MSGMHSGYRMRFLCDPNLGKLAKWLRILGYDAEYMASWNDDRITQAIAESRTVLTRKTIAGPCSDIVHIHNDHVREQLKELFRSLHIREIPQPFTRCSICNTLLISASPESVHGLIPDYVQSTHDGFARCPSCNRTYWKGTHISGIYDMIDHLLKEKT